MRILSTKDTKKKNKTKIKYYSLNDVHKFFNLINAITIYGPPWTVVGGIINPMISKQQHFRRELITLS
jgi:hypothetical protein